MNKQIKSFMSFVRTQGVVGLAVGLAIGTQVGKAVEAIVNGLIDPIVGFIVGNQHGLQAAKWTIVKANGPNSRSLVLGWGEILSALITLIAVSAVIYWVVMGLRLDKTEKEADSKNNKAKE